MAERLYSSEYRNVSGKAPFCNRVSYPAARNTGRPQEATAVQEGVLLWV